MSDFSACLSKLSFEDLNLDFGTNFFFRASLKKPGPACRRSGQTSKINFGSDSIIKQSFRRCFYHGIYAGIFSHTIGVLSTSVARKYLLAW